MSLRTQLSDRIRQKALDAGFDAVGIAPAQPSPHAPDYFQWLKEGHHGDMAWLAREPHRRADPTVVLPGAKSVVVVGLSYYVAEPPAEVWNDPLRGRIARYAWGRDYHDVMLPLLEELARFITAESGAAAQSRCYVDTGPVLERDVAAQAGLGFIGKNTLLINPSLGSYLFLGEVLVAAKLDYDKPATDGGATLQQPDISGRVGTCGTCRRCQDICPTHAFPAPYILNSRLCISYLTIEHRGAIPVELRPLMRNWIYGCDECQTVCPWVKQFSTPQRMRFLKLDLEFIAPKLTDLMMLDESGFRDRYEGTPITRAKRRGLLRNAAIALGNSGMAEVLPVLDEACRDEEPLIREHAEWAMDRIKKSIG
jgi:epoxyqueuosine reductase